MYSQNTEDVHNLSTILGDTQAVSNNDHNPQELQLSQVRVQRKQAEENALRLQNRIWYLELERSKARKKIG